LLVADEDGRVVETADLVVIPNLTRGARPVALVENVVVTAERRGGRVGRALMDEAERRARSAGCYKIQLLSNAYRTRAHAFYRALDYETSVEGFRKYLI
jgi:GNAT superfamily N-acetyltransferase